MLNSCFRFRCAIVQAGSVVIFPPPLSQPPLSSLWSTCFLATFISAAPPTSRTTHVARFEAFLAWLLGKLFSNKFLLHFGVQFECGLHVNARQTGLPGLPAPCLPLNFCQIVQQLSSPVAVRQCTMWSVVQLLKRVHVVAMSRETCRCITAFPLDVADILNTQVFTRTNCLLHLMNFNWNQFYLEEI